MKRRASVTKLRKSVCASNKRGVGDVPNRPLRERVTHMLALRPYTRPDLILRLQKDGLTAGDEDMLDSMLLEVMSFSFFIQKYTAVFEGR